VHRLARALRVPSRGAVFLAATVSSLCTYVVTALQLALAFPAQQGGVGASAARFLLVFVPTQVPLAVSEGLLTVLVVNLLRSHLGNDARFPALGGSAR
jgi:cobalt/nickel transport system permease protein